MLTSAPFDDWWHNTYGLDVKILSPPHAVLAAGIGAIQIGAMLMVVAWQNRSGGRIAAAAVAVFLQRRSDAAQHGHALDRIHRPVGDAPVALLSSRVRDVPVRARGRRARVGRALAGDLGGCGIYRDHDADAVDPAALRGPAAARADLRAMDRFLPPDPPLLLIAPAIVIDIADAPVRPRLETGGCRRSSPSRSSSVFVAVQWPFADFLMSPWARNWIFATNRMAYMVPPAVQARWYRDQSARQPRARACRSRSCSRSCRRGGDCRGAIGWRGCSDEPRRARAAGAELSVAGARAGCRWRTSAAPTRSSQAGGPLSRPCDGTAAGRRFPDWRRSPSDCRHVARQAIRRVTVRAIQWNLGPEGAPPADVATPVPGDPELYAADLWLMVADVVSRARRGRRPAGAGTAIVPVIALATAQREMPRGAGLVLAGLGLFLGCGLLTIVGVAVRESVVPPGEAPDPERRRRSRMAMAVRAVRAELAHRRRARLVERRSDRIRASRCSIGRSRRKRRDARTAARSVLTLTIRDRRWPPAGNAVTRYNALMPDHGKLMHMFLVREPNSARSRTCIRCRDRLRARRSTSRFRRCRPAAIASTATSCTRAATRRRSSPARRSAMPLGAARRRPTLDDSWFAGQAMPESSSATFTGTGWHDDHVAAWCATRRRAGAAAHVRRAQRRSDRPPGSNPTWACSARGRHEPRRVRVRASASVGQHLDGGAAEVRRRRIRTLSTAPIERKRSVDSLRVSKGRAIPHLDSDETRRPGRDRRVRGVSSFRLRCAFLAARGAS